METGTDFRNWVKLELIINRATEILRILFLKRWKLMNKDKEWTNTRETGAEFIQGLGQKAYISGGKLQKLSLLSGDVNQWDLTTVAKVLQITQFFVSGPENKSFQIQMKQECKKIEQLSSVRNKAAHNPTKNITDDEFNGFWNEMVGILISLGDSEEELDLLKKKSLIAGIEFKTESDNENEENKAKAAQLKEIGNEHFWNQMYTEAVGKYTEALALAGLNDRDCAVLYSNRSIAYLNLHTSKQGKKSGFIGAPTDNNDPRYLALYDAKQAMKLWPTWWRAYYRAGCAYDELNKFSKAIYYFDRALALEPTKHEIKMARDASRLKFGQESRYEHLDQRFLPKSTEESLMDFNKTGLNFTPELLAQIEKYMDESNPISDVIRAHRYRDGIDGVQQDYELAAKYYGKAARKGNAEGMYNLALLTSRGKGVNKNQRLANKLLEQAAKQPPTLFKPNINNVGVAEAQHALGFRYQEGVGVAKGPATAVTWYLRASENGSGNAANNLGLMYMNGSGVERNLEKAKQYLTLAASRQDPNAMETLAYYYLEIGDLEIAQDWHSRAIANGNFHADLKKDEFENQILMKKSKIGIKDLSKWESENGLNIEGLTFEERSTRMLTCNLPQQKSELLKDFLNLETKMKTQQLPRKIREGYLKYDLPAIVKYAGNGSVTAHRMKTAMKKLFLAIMALEESEASKGDLTARNDSDRRFVYNFAHSIRKEEIVATLPIDLTEKAIALVNRILKSQGNSKSQLDIDARVCHAHLHANSLEETIAFLKECSQKYLKESFFYRLRGCLFGFSKNYKDGLNELNSAALLSPDYHDILYERAAMMRLVEISDVDETINAYLSFLENAPKDHRKVPESYYAMSSCLLAKVQPSKMRQVKKHEALKPSDDLVLQMKAYYELGLEAEKIQLPYFLPYKSNNKSMLEIVLRMFDEKHEDPKPSQSNIPTSNHLKPMDINEKLKNPLRIEIIRKHREYSVEMLTKLVSNEIIPSTRPALKQQKAPNSILGLKPIKLRDMDPTRNHIYEGYIIRLTMIEDAITGGSSIKTVVQDDNGDVQRCYIYNFQHENDSIIQDTYGIGCKMSLINPYMLMAHDRRPAIRVDDPGSLFNIGNEQRIKNMCRYCGSENAKHVCSRCFRARYCDRNCQTNDWKVYKHKLICKDTL